MVKYYHQILAIQTKMSHQLEFNHYRMDYLHEYFQKELREYQMDLSASKKKAHKALLKLLPKLNWELAKHLLRLYVARCKFRHAFAFL